MFETGVAVREIKAGEWNGLPVLFRGSLMPASISIYCRNVLYVEQI